MSGVPAWPLSTEAWLLLGGVVTAFVAFMIWVGIHSNAPARLWLMTAWLVTMLAVVPLLAAASTDHEWAKYLAAVLILGPIVVWVFAVSAAADREKTRDQ